MTTRILPATRYDIDEVVSFMRASDREETLFCAQATGRWHPLWSAREDILSVADCSELHTMWHGDAVMGLGGVVPHPALPAIWFLGTDLADRFPIAMTRACRAFVRAQARRFPRLGNVVPGHDTRRIAWLRYLGFDFPEIEAQHLPQGLVVFMSQAPHGPDA